SPRSVSWPFPKHRETSAMKHPPQGETITLDWSNHIRERPPWRSVNPVFTVYRVSWNATEGVPYRKSPLPSVKWYHYQAPAAVERQAPQG
ncbi:MAG TPA: hypothetical protein VMV10_04815, partial [Pirellulales bacterium]|nr:hypothetical protein [Pirellulales bacterium]